MEERRKLLRRQSDRNLAEGTKGKSAEEAEDYLKRQRRRAIRHHCMAKLTIDVVSKAGVSGEWKGRTDSIKARVLDLSETGASVFAAVPLSTGQRTQVQVFLPDGSQIEALAEVRWTKEKDSKGGYAAGLRFVQIGAKDEIRVRAFLQDLEETLGF